MYDIYTVKGSHFSIYPYPDGCSVVRWLSEKKFHVIDSNLSLADAKRRINVLIAATHDTAARIEKH